jgi:small subunit ribosomal protein S2
MCELAADAVLAGSGKEQISVEEMTSEAPAVEAAPTASATDAPVIEASAAASE